MTVQTPDELERIAQPLTQAAFILILAVLAFRVAMLFFSASGLHGDEAQYWAWAQDPAFGYYSKPPLIAWIIWVTTAVFGDAEWAVRFASPFLHAGAALFTFLTARRLFGEKAGLIASALYVLAPGVALSASLISTDAALLFCISVFLYAWTRLREQPSWGWTVGLGIALGFGFLAKYAMMYVLPAFLLALVLEPKTRAALLNLRGLVAGAITGLILLPNLIWNAQNDFATVVHTGDNANLSDGIQLKPGEWFEFFTGQLGVFGPLAFLLLLVAVWQLRKTRGFTPYLLILVLTPLLVISIQALISRANANWAAAAYASAPILLASWAVQAGARRKWVAAALAINLVFTVVPPIVMTSPTLTDRLGFANAVKRQRGWPETVAAIRDQFETGEFETIAVDNRLMFYATTYYGVEDIAPLRMWRFEPRLNSHAELTSRLEIEAENVLLISYYHPTYEAYFEQDFETLTPLGEMNIELGGGKVRRLKAYAASGYKGPVPRN